MYCVAIVLLVFKIVVIYTEVESVGVGRIYNRDNLGVQGSICLVQSNCVHWLQCIDHRCTLCKPQDSICEQDIVHNDKCCKGTTCEPIPGLYTWHCRPNQNNCTSDKDCIGELKCLLNKCGLCKPNEPCTLVQYPRKLFN